MKLGGKKLWIVVLIFGLFVFANVVFATPGCYILPEYVNEFDQYYNNVTFNEDNCYPVFTFTTPNSYSKFRIPYKVKVGRSLDADNITQYDSMIRKKISIIENCSRFEKYVKLKRSFQDLNKDPLYLDGFPLRYYNKTDCGSDIKDDIRQLEWRKLVRDFLSEYKGDYNQCRWSGNEYLGGEDYKKFSTYINCDGRRELLILVFEEKGNITMENIKAGYFGNSQSEYYRKIYPEDVKLRERDVAWETDFSSFVFIYLLFSHLYFLLPIPLIFLL